MQAITREQAEMELKNALGLYVNAHNAGDQQQLEEISKLLPSRFFWATYRTQEAELGRDAPLAEKAKPLIIEHNLFSTILGGFYSYLPQQEKAQRRKDFARPAPEGARQDGSPIKSNLVMMFESLKQQDSQKFQQIMGHRQLDDIIALDRWQKYADFYNETYRATDEMFGLDYPTSDQELKGVVINTLGNHRNEVDNVIKQLLDKLAGRINEQQSQELARVIKNIGKSFVGPKVVDKFSNFVHDPDAQEAYERLKNQFSMMGKLNGPLKTANAELDTILRAIGLTPQEVESLGFGATLDRVADIYENGFHTINRSISQQPQQQQQQQQGANRLEQRQQEDLQQKGQEINIPQIPRFFTNPPDRALGELYKAVKGVVAQLQGATPSKTVVGAWFGPSKIDPNQAGLGSGSQSTQGHPLQNAQVNPTSEIDRHLYLSYLWARLEKNRLRPEDPMNVEVDKYLEFLSALKAESASNPNLRPEEILARKKEFEEKMSKERGKKFDFWKASTVDINQKFGDIAYSLGDDKIKADNIAYLNALGIDAQKQEVAFGFSAAVNSKQPIAPEDMAGGTAFFMGLGLRAMQHDLKIEKQQILEQQQAPTAPMPPQEQATQQQPVTPVQTPPQQEGVPPAQPPVQEATVAQPEQPAVAEQPPSAPQPTQEQGTDELTQSEERAARNSSRLPQSDKQALFNLARSIPGATAAHEYFASYGVNNFVLDIVQKLKEAQSQTDVNNAFGQYLLHDEHVIQIQDFINKAAQQMGGGTASPVEQTTQPAAEVPVTTVEGEQVTPNGIIIPNDNGTEQEQDQRTPEEEAERAQLVRQLSPQTSSQEHIKNPDALTAEQLANLSPEEFAQYRNAIAKQSLYGQNQEHNNEP